MTWPGITEEQQGTLYRDVFMDPDFGKTVSWIVTRGRDFSRDFATDSDAMILNETAAKATGFKNPIGQAVNMDQHDYHIIGVVKDMLTNSPYQSVEAAVFVQRGSRNTITMRLNPNKPVHTALAGLAPIFKRYNPSSPFLYRLSATTIAAKFAEENAPATSPPSSPPWPSSSPASASSASPPSSPNNAQKKSASAKSSAPASSRLWGLLSKDFLKLTAIPSCSSPSRCHGTA